ncbi:WbqC family protein [Eisenibacter elegans]|uniref:WbqC family protein n=1 Tax=Eisenibacter elegans TaxID=997 RepID=UPI00040AC2ED|nr:WbqC family protein [Eisenibacter elegans]
MPEKYLIDLQYAPCLAYMAVCMAAPDKVKVDIHEHYQKQSYRNRCYILSSQGIVPLSIPIIKGNSQHKQAMCQVMIDNSQRWQQIHWRSIVTAYRKAPYFEHYADYFTPIYAQQYDLLADFNWALLTTCLQILGASQTPQKSTQYQAQADLPPSEQDLRDLIHPKKGYAPGRQNDTKPYLQVFGKPFEEFVPNLSILDLLFCCGVEARSYLQQNFNKTHLLQQLI